MPPFDSRPYPTHPATLYTPEDLSFGFGQEGFAGMYDTRVYEHFLAHGGAAPDIREAIAQRLHDAGDRQRARQGSRRLGQGARHPGRGRDHGRARRTARLRRVPDGGSAGLAAGRRGRLIVTGGGPGVMEAANLGAYFAARPKWNSARPSTSCPWRRISWTTIPTRPRPSRCARPFRRRRPRSDDLAGRLTHGGLALPTWLYGHEPANLFAGQIGKYFSNAVREDSILRLSRGGIVFAPGWAGTVQEVFQAATKTFYQTDGPSGAFVFLGVEHWARCRSRRCSGRCWPGRRTVTSRT